MEDTLSVRDQESTENSDDQDKGKSKSRRLKFVLLPLILVVQAIVAYYLVFNVLLKHAQHARIPDALKQELKVGKFFEIDDIVINPANSDGRRYLVVELGLETDSSSLLAEATSKEIWIRDAIISLLTTKTVEELMDVTSREKLKAEMLDRLNHKLLKGQFSRLYFKKYIIQ